MNQFEEIIKETKTKEKQLTRLNNEIAKLEKSLSKMMEAYEDGIYSKEVFLSRSNTTKTEIKSLRDEISALQSAENKEAEVFRKRIPILDKCLKSYNQLSPKERNELLKIIVERIDYTKTERGTPHRSNGDNFTISVKFRQ